MNIKIFLDKIINFKLYFQPDIFAPYLFVFANRSDLTQKYVRWLLDNKYTTEPDGIPGNDDYGIIFFINFVLKYFFYL